MNVIGHNDPGKQFIISPNYLAVQQRVNKQIRNFRFSKPLRPCTKPVQFSVRKQECSPGIGIIHQSSGPRQRQRPRQAPRHKSNRILWNPMWKPSSPNHVGY